MHMGLFSKKKHEASGLIGIDIGAGGMKAVELVQQDGRLRLKTYAYSALKDRSKDQKALLEDPKRAGVILREMMKKAKMTSSEANASLPSHSVFHAIVTIPQPKDAKEDIKPMIDTQVKKLLPMPIEDMILDSTVIDKHLLPKAKPVEKRKEKKGDVVTKTSEPVDIGISARKTQQHIRVLISGAPKELVAKYIAIFKSAKLTLASLETEAFALIRSLVGKDPSRIMIVDVGFERTNITIVDGGIPYLHRSIKAGGQNVTAMIAKQMSLPMDQAEQAKLDMALGVPKDQIPPVLREAMMPILHEIRYSFELYGQQLFHENSTVEKIILTGGSALIPQLDPFLTEALNMNVYLGDPWARIAAPEGLRPVLNEIGPRFSVSLGLAMKLSGKSKSLKK